MRTSILATAIAASLSTFALAADPIYVLRPPTVPSAAKVLPQDAFGASAPTAPTAPSAPGTPSTPGNSDDPDVLLFQSPEWVYAFENFKYQYVTFSQPPTIKASVSLSKDDGYYYKFPSGADICYTGRIDSLFGTRLGSLENGHYVTHINPQGTFDLYTIDPKKVGTYRVLITCQGPGIWDTKTNAPPITPPFYWFGSFQRIELRVTE